VQVQLRKQLAHLAGVADEQGEDSALESLIQITHSWTTNGDGAATQGEVAWLAVAVAITSQAIKELTALTLVTTKKFGHFLF
jgi:hypothetical protein